MSNFSEPKVRIDQSHCNYQLSNWLASNGWTVLFRDPGRVSRGTSGTQAIVLGVFERTGLPIPDIAATKDGILLLVEVDKSAKNNSGSFLSYRTNHQLILNELNNVGGIKAKSLSVGFCKVGNERSPSSLMELYDLDMVAAFESVAPVVIWRNLFPE